MGKLVDLDAIVDEVIRRMDRCDNEIGCPDGARVLEDLLDWLKDVPTVGSEEVP